MTSVTQNGWSRYSTIRKYDVPGTRCNTLWLNTTAAPLLLYVARRFHNEVMAHDSTPLQCWGFARSGPIPGSWVYSNHESGTAIDLNATRMPWGLDRLNASQERKCREIAKATGGMVRWGGSYNGKIDQMHWEIDGTPAQVRAQIARMNLRANGTVRPKFPMTSEKKFARRNDGIYRNGTNLSEPNQAWGVRMIQNHLGLRADGSFGSKTEAALFKRYGWKVVGKTRWEQMFR